MASLPGGRKLISKHESLMQDYHHLVRETHGLEARVQEAKDRRSRLLAEVRFLRCKHKILSCNQMPTNRAEKISRFRNSETPSRNDHWRKNSEEDCPKKNRALLDLNQASQPMEQDEEPEWEPLTLEKKAKVDATENDPLTSDWKLPIFRGISTAIDGGSRGTKRLVGKRKISWHDQAGSSYSAQPRGTGFLDPQ